MPITAATASFTADQSGIVHVLVTHAPTGPSAPSASTDPLIRLLESGARSERELLAERWKYEALEKKTALLEAQVQVATGETAVSALDGTAPGHAAVGATASPAFQASATSESTVPLSASVARDASSVSEASAINESLSNTESLNGARKVDKGKKAEREAPTVRALWIHHLIEESPREIKTTRLPIQLGESEDLQEAISQTCGIYRELIRLTFKTGAGDDGDRAFGMDKMEWAPACFEDGLAVRSPDTTFTVDKLGIVHAFVTNGPMDRSLVENASQTFWSNVGNHRDEPAYSEGQGDSGEETDISAPFASDDDSSQQADARLQDHPGRQYLLFACQRIIDMVVTSATFYLGRLVGDAFGYTNDEDWPSTSEFQAWLRRHRSGYLEHVAAAGAHSDLVTMAIELIERASAGQIFDVAHAAMTDQFGPAYGICDDIRNDRGKLIDERSFEACLTLSLHKAGPANLRLLFKFATAAKAELDPDHVDEHGDGPAQECPPHQWYTHHQASRLRPSPDADVQKRHKLDCLDFLQKFDGLGARSASA